MSADSKAPPLQIRGLSSEAYDRFRRGAAARNMTQSRYLEQLLELHREILAMSTEHAYEHTDKLTLMLFDLGLQPVTNV